VADPAYRREHERGEWLQAHPTAASRRVFLAAHAGRSGRAWREVAP
jgi:hypothetical protein